MCLIYLCNKYNIQSWRDKHTDGGIDSTSNFRISLCLFVHIEGKAKAITRRYVNVRLKLISTSSYSLNIDSYMFLFIFNFFYSKAIYVMGKSGFLWEFASSTRNTSPLRLSCYLHMTDRIPTNCKP